MEIRMEVEDQFIKRLQSDLQLRGTDIVREALTILNWAVNERRLGRVILSADTTGGNVVRLAMPSLEAIHTEGVARR
jgi:predicted RNA polymerase sigma factor